MLLPRLALRPFSHRFRKLNKLHNVIDSNLSELALSAWILYIHIYIYIYMIDPNWSWCKIQQTTTCLTTDYLHHAAQIRSAESPSLHLHSLKLSPGSFVCRPTLESWCTRSLEPHAGCSTCLKEALNPKPIPKIRNPKRGVIRSISTSWPQMSDFLVACAAVVVTGFIVSRGKRRPLWIKVPWPLKWWSDNNCPFVFFNGLSMPILILEGKFVQTSSLKRPMTSS